MRISDWSSDVCSSDLLRVRTGEHEIERLAEFEHLKVAVIDIEGVDVEAVLIVEPRGLGAEVEAVEPLGLDAERRLRGILRLAGVGARRVAADRTCVVQGKGGSVRVDIGVLGNSKKKKT